MYIKNNVMIPMNDGALLATDIYRSAKVGTAPVLLARTPYNKNNIGDYVQNFVDNGYVVVVQDVRGRYASEGIFNPHYHEKEDGLETINWIMEQPWCDGHIGMFGGSYLGGTQWLAASKNPKGLCAMIPEVTFDDLYEGTTFQGGAKILHDLRWTVADIIPDAVRRYEEKQGIKETRDFPDVHTALDELPLATHPMIDDYAGFYKKWLNHDSAIKYWENISPNSGYNQITVPVLNISGWYDVFVPSTIRNYLGMKANAGSANAKNQQYLLMGPWSHMNFSGKFPERDFGETAGVEAIDLMGIKLRWYDRWMKNSQNTEILKTHVKIFVMGIDQWKDEEDWPLPQTHYQAFYLHSAGNANTLNGDGTLGWNQPSEEANDSFVYEPMNPVPSLGGQVILPGENAIGPRDQRQVEMREDVLVYTSEIMEKDLEVIGSIRMKLYASSDSLDTDFTAKLVDVYPDGRAMILTDGIIRARYRESTKSSKLLEFNQVYCFDIDLGATANMFLKGHQIRLEISSSNFPKFNRNSNTGGDISKEAAEDYQKAINNVFHNDQYPSHLVMPVINRDNE